MKRPAKRIVRYQISLTYRCNLRCKDCYMFNDHLDWPDSDITVEDIRKGGQLLKQHGIVIQQKLRIGGGEPTLHPRLKECCLAAREEWKKGVPLIMSNMIESIPSGTKARLRRSPMGEFKLSCHRPQLISPADLGMEPLGGFMRSCKGQKGCGRLFDKWGFAPCVFATGRGRLLGIDPYQPRPILMGQPEMCQHCHHSQPPKMQRKLTDMAIAGKIEYPTKTYREGLERWRDEPVQFRTFRERLSPQ